MSWLLFMDESGHDHQHCPYEVRGGVALHVSKLWSFVMRLRAAEMRAFGARLQDYKKEIKGSKLLDKDRYKWAAQDQPMLDQERQRHCRAFLTKGLEKKPPTKAEFTAYGQANLFMAHAVFDALRDYEAKIFSALIPASVQHPQTPTANKFLRKDHVFLLERFFNFLAGHDDHGLLVMDEVEKVSDRRFVRQMEGYFLNSEPGKHRASRIVPVPMFVASDMSLPVQAADLVIYAINWGYRNEALGLDAPFRQEIADHFRDKMGTLQYQGLIQDGRHTREQWGIFYVPNPYGSGRI